MSKKEMKHALKKLRNEMLNPEMMMKKHNIKKDAYYTWMTGWVMGTIEYILKK